MTTVAQFLPEKPLVLPPPVQPAPPQIVQCAPRNAWESFISSLSYEARALFLDGFWILVLICMLAVVGALVTHMFRRTGQQAAAYAMVMSGVGGTALAFAFMSYPRHKPYLVGVGVSLAVGSALAAINVVRRRQP